MNLQIKCIALLVFATISFELFGQYQNVSLNKSAEASSIENQSMVASNAIDGDNTTRWASAFSDPQWIILDLQATHYISSIEILWEAASALNYTVDISYDNSSWTTISTRTGMPAGPRTDNIDAINKYARYVRMNGTARNTDYGYSIFELTVMGSPISCFEEMVNGDFNWYVGSNNGNPEITFIPVRDGVAVNDLQATNTPILFYFGKDPAQINSWGANHLNPNEPFVLNFPVGHGANEPLYFYFTYSVDDFPVTENNTRNALGVITQSSCDCSDYYAVLSERTVFTNGFNDGVDGQFYFWEGTFVNIPDADAYEGNSAFAIEQQGVETWAGAAIHTYAAGPSPVLDLSAFANGSYNFAVKIPEGSAHTFYVFIQDIVGQVSTEGRIYFEPGNDPAGVLRDGLWHKVSVPLSDLSASGLNLSQIKHPFGVFSGTQGNGQMYYFDDIYFSCNKNHIKTFTGISGNSWSLANNWNPPGIPLANEIAVIESGKHIDINGEASVFDLILKPNSKMSALSGSTVGVDSYLHIESSGLGTGSLIDNGVLTIGQSGVFRKFLDGDIIYGWTVVSPVSSADNAVFSGSDGVFYYDAQIAAWANFAAGSMQAMRGYWTKFPGNHALRLSASIFNTGQFVFTDFYRTGYNFGNSGWNFIGNPYPSAINWDAVVVLNGGEDFVVNTKLNAAIYVSDHSGGYSSYVDGVGTNGFAGNIPAATAFWVQINQNHVYSDTPVPLSSLMVNNSVRTHSGDDGSLKSSSTLQEEIVRIFLEVNGRTDEAVVRFKPEATIYFDPGYDALKRFSTDRNTPQVAVKEASGNLLSIYSVGNISEPSFSVPLIVKSVLNQEHALKVEFTDGNAFHSMVLEDRALNQFYPIAHGQSYALSPVVGTESERFILHFDLFKISTNNTQQFADAPGFEVVDGKLYIKGIDDSRAVLEIYNVSGNIIMQYPSVESFSVLHPPLAKGVYVVRLITAGEVYTDKVLIN